MRGSILSLIVSSFLVCQLTHASSNLDVSQAVVLGGEWPFPMLIEPLESDEIQGVWQLWDQGLLLEVSSLGETKEGQAAWIELREVQTDRIVASGALVKTNGVFEGFVKYFDDTKPLPWVHVMVGRGRYREGGRAYYYYLEQSESGQWVRTHVMSRTSPTRAEVIFGSDGSATILITQAGSDAGRLFDQMKVEAKDDGQTYRKEVRSQDGQFSLRCLIIKQIEMPSCTFEFKRGNHTVINQEEKLIIYSLNGAAGGDLSQLFYGDFQVQGLPLVIIAQKNQFRVEYNR